MSAAEREARRAHTARDHAHATSATTDREDPKVEAVDLAERLDAYGAALGDLARALADELTEPGS